MKIECTVEEFKELTNKNTPVAITTDVIKETEGEEPKDVLPPHKFPLLNLQEYQRIYKEAQQEVPKEDLR